MMSTCSGRSIGAWSTVAKQARDESISSLLRGIDRLAAFSSAIAFRPSCLVNKCLF